MSRCLFYGNDEDLPEKPSFFKTFLVVLVAGFFFLLLLDSLGEKDSTDYFWIEEEEFVKASVNMKREFSGEFFIDNKIAGRIEKMAGEPPRIAVYGQDGQLSPFTEIPIDGGVYVREKQWILIEEIDGIPHVVIRKVGGE